VGRAGKRSRETFGEERTGALAFTPVLRNPFYAANILSLRYQMRYYLRYCLTR
jgi:hypothetical protein